MRRQSRGFYGALIPEAILRNMNDVVLTIIAVLGLVEFCFLVWWMMKRHRKKR
jgi:hypothetical protein